MSAWRMGTVLFALAAVLSCAGSRLSTMPVASKLNAPVRVIAMDPGGGLLADAIGVELSNRGFSVLDSTSTSRLMARLNLDEVEITTPVGLEKLKSEGVDAYLTVRSAGGYDQQVQSASARVNATDTGKVIAGVSWQNGWGGQAGSMADRTMRKGLAEAAAEITEGLTKSLTPP